MKLYPKKQTPQQHPDLEALARGLAALVAPMVAELLQASPKPFSQLEGERPSGAGRVAYLRAHRALVRSGDPGAWSEGRARLMSPDAWARAMANHRHAPKAPASETRPVDPDADALEALGLAKRTA
jgi:hypothetical protein